MKRYAFSLFLVGIILGLSLCFVDFAFSIPTSQQDCDLDQHSTISQTYGFVPGSIVTVQNGSLLRQCVIQFSATVSSPSDDLIGITYSIDGGACTTFGPEAFHEGSNTETHTNISVVQLGQGVHTIQPCWVLIDLDFSGGGTAYLAQRCLIVECRTN